MKISAVGSELFTYGQTDMRKLRALFRNFANEPKNYIFQDCVHGLWASMTKSRASEVLCL